MVSACFICCFDVFELCIDKPVLQLLVLRWVDSVYCLYNYFVYLSFATCVGFGC